MSDYYEVDFLDVPSTKGGDAIAIRYRINGSVVIHVVDGGYQDTSESISKHLEKYYDDPSRIDHVVLTHQDNDHAGGLRGVLEEYDIGKLWMLRPWLYVDELLPRFSRFTNKENLIKRLKEIYSNIAALELIAIEKGITIGEPLQGTKIGQFTVVSPTREYFLDKVVDSDKTPTATESVSSKSFSQVLTEAVKYIKKAWGIETFSEEETTCENEMSIVQFSYLCGESILLTGDAGRGALSIAKDYLTKNGIVLPKIDRFQVPHHGSRRNISSALLNSFLGNKLPAPTLNEEYKGIAVISASADDENHPRKATLRALMHRGYHVGMTKGRNLCFSKDAPHRSDYSPIAKIPYPDEEED